MAESAQARYDIFLERRDRLAKIIEQQLEILVALRLMNLEESLRKLQQGVLADTFKVLVIGEFKRGKSTFVNALLGKKVLPAHADPTTAIISEVKWGEEPKALLHYPGKPDGSPGRTHEVLIENLEQYIVIKKYDRAFTYENPYEKVEIFWPLELCKNHIEIIDSPGLNEDIERQKITLSYLSSIDATIFVVSCDAPVSLTEENVIEMITESGHKNVFFICTHIDKYDDDDEEQRRVKNHCRQRLGSLIEYGNQVTFFINARKALRGKIEQNDATIQASGILEIEKALKDFLAMERGRVKIVLPGMAMLGVINDLWKDIPDREKMLHTNLADINVRQIQMETHLVASEAECQQIIAHLERFRLTTETFVENAAIVFFKASIPNISRWIQEYQVQQPIKLREILSRSAYERVGAEVARFLTHQLNQAYKDWQEATLFQELNTRFQKQIEELGARIQAFTNGLEQVRFKIDANQETTNITRRNNRQTELEYLLLRADDLFLRSSPVGIFGSLFNWKTAMGGLTSSAVALPLVAILSWNPLLLVPAALAGMIVTVGMGAPAITNAIKNVVSKQYEDRFAASLPELGSAVRHDLGERLISYKNDLSQQLFLKIQNIRDQVKAVLMKKEEGQTAVDQELNMLQAIKRQLSLLDDDLRELFAEVIREL